jgi:hypothetical protein
MRELFIYYQVQAAQAVHMRTAVMRMQKQLQQSHPALITRLLRRPETTATDLQTWMETYATQPQLEPAGITSLLQAHIESCANTLLPHLHGPRHVEVFTALVTDESA